MKKKEQLATEVKLNSGESLKNIGKVVICHYPPELPGNLHEILADVAATKAHLAHGDALGACPKPPIPTPKPTCLPRPTCLDAVPKCLLSEPIGGWCPAPTPTAVPTPTPTPIPTPTTTVSPNPTPTLTITPAPTPTPTSTPIPTSTPTPTPTLSPTPIPTPTVFLPDIEPFSLHAANAYSGVSNYVSAGWTNVGTAVLSQNFSFKFYVNGNFICEKTQIVYSPMPVMGGGSNSSGQSCSYVFTVPGDYTVTAILDANNEVAELQETNNTITATVSIVESSRTLADLVLGYMYPSHHYSGQQNAIYAHIYNAGVATIPGGFVIRTFVNGELAGERTVTGDVLPGSGAGYGTLPYVFPSSGVYEIKIVTDATNLVPEESEGNNTNIQSTAMK